MKQLIFLIVAVVLAIAATVLAFIFVVPEKRREKLNAFGKFLHDLCTFKFLVVEKILQALYIFSTAFIVLYGVLQLFNVQRDYWTGASRWMGGTGLLCIIVGPIAIRLSYELMMMAILLVKNVISINRKLADETGSAGGDVFAAPDVEELKRLSSARSRSPSLRFSLNPRFSPSRRTSPSQNRSPQFSPSPFGRSLPGPPSSAGSAAADWKTAFAPSAGSPRRSSKRQHSKKAVRRMPDGLFSCG